MASTAAATVTEYLAGLPAERRNVVRALRTMVKRALPKGYTERINYNVLVYEIPLSRYPETNNGQPLAYVAVAAQKNHYAIYLTCAYQDPKQAAWLRKEFTKAGKKVGHGKILPPIQGAVRHSTRGGQYGHPRHPAGEIHRAV